MRRSVPIVFVISSLLCVGSSIVARAASLQLTPVRTIGGPGHAGLYGWGADTMPDGSVLFSDYWNFRVQHYGEDGTLLGTIIGKDGRHQAPYDVAVDPRNGDIYLGDVDGGHTVDKYDQGGRYLFSFGGCCTGPGRYTYPAYLTVNSVGRVFVSDSRDDNVVAVSPTGTELFQIGSSGSANGKFHTPRGIGVDAQDRVFVADTNNHRVQVFDSNGAFLFSFGQGGSGPALTSDLRGLTVDKAHGWVYLVDAGTGYVNKYDTGGHYLLRLGGFGTADGRFVNGGRCVTVDGDGNVWVADLADFRAEKFSPSGAFLLAVPQPPQPPPPGGFNQPGGVAVDSAGNIFVTDSFNWRIERFQPDGTFLLQWGTRAILDYARGIAVDRNDGTVIVADTDQVKVKKFTPTGQLLWSAPGKAFDVDVGGNGRIYVPDFQQKIVRVLSPNGGQVASWGGSFRFPRGIAVDPDGTVWVSDSQRGDVQHFTASGSLLGRIGAGKLAQAGGVAVDSTYVYVSDTDANRIKVWTKAGVFVGAFMYGNTPILGPMGLDIIGNHLYVAERSGERIRELQISPT